jgi:hypothetical protein
LELGIFTVAFQRVARPAETFFTVVAGSAICCISITIIILGAAAPKGEALAPWLALLFALPFLLLDLPYLIHLWRWRAPRSCPRALYIAKNQPLWPKAVRPLICVWWLAHFGLAAAFALPAHFIAVVPPGSPFGHKLWRGLLAVAVATGMCATANQFLLAAVAALTRRENVLDATWRMRHSIDVAIATAVCFLPLTG